MQRPPNVAIRAVVLRSATAQNNMTEIFTGSSSIWQCLAAKLTQHQVKQTHLHISSSKQALVQCARELVHSLFGVQVPPAGGQLSVLALAVLPLVAESIALGLCLGLWLKLHVFIAVAGALILSAVCPALTGATMHEWQQARLGIRQGMLFKTYCVLVLEACETAFMLEQLSSCVMRLLSRVVHSACKLTCGCSWFELVAACLRE